MNKVDCLYCFCEGVCCGKALVVFVDLSRGSTK